MKMLRREDDGSEQPSSSDPGLSLLIRNLIRRMVREKFQREINLIRGEIRNVVKEEIQKVLPQGTRIDVPEERSLHLKFLDEVSGPVLTSKEFKGIRDGPLKVALFDATGNPVTSGPESSAEVEIVLIDATGNDNESSTTNENFERRIIRAGDKEKPHFAKTVYVKLEKGEAVLINQKLGQDKDWTKAWICRLGARFVKDFNGLKVQKAWTEPFEVKDKRGVLYKKHSTPFLTSEVWRLKEICRDGKPCRRLEAEEIKTVQDFLFVLSVNPERLREILGAGKNRWNTIVDHAKTCIIDDERLYCLKSCTEPRMDVVYDLVGQLKGVIIEESHFVPIDNLSADEKEHALELLSKVLDPAAFVGRYQTFFNDEASLLQQYPYKSSGDKRLYDEVSHLVCIRGGGNINKRLKYSNIYTVEDFLIQLLINPGGLKNIVKSQAKKWEAYVNKARACLSGQRVSFYMDLERIGHVLGLHLYTRTSTLSEEEKAILQNKLLASAYQNREEVKAFDDQNSLLQNLSCLGKMVRESPSGCMNMSSTMNLFDGHENDFGSFITGGDDDIDIPCNAAMQLHHEWRPSIIDFVQQMSGCIIDLNAVKAQAITESNAIKKRKAHCI